MNRFDKWVGDSFFRFIGAFIGGAALVLGMIFGVLVLIFGLPIDEDAEHRDLCRGLNGSYVDGGKYGDDTCFGPDGRLVKVW